MPVRRSRLLTAALALALVGSALPATSASASAPASGGGLTTAEVLAAGHARAALAGTDDDDRRPDGTVPLVVAERRPDGGVDVTQHAVRDEADAAAVIADATRAGRFVAASVDRPVALAQTQTPAPAPASADPYRAQQWALDAVSYPGAWTTTTGSGVTVAVLDTGVDAAHPDLVGRVLPGRHFLHVGSTPQSGPGADDDHYHGTHVAGIIAANAGNGTGIAGAAPGVSILPVKVLDANGSGWFSDVAAAITWSVDQGADIINLSLGAPGTDPVVAAAIADATTRGVAVFAAAGNSGCVVGTSGCGAFYPASDPGAIAVGSIQSNRACSGFTTQASYVALGAPGSSILATVPTAAAPSNPYATLSGTSMATPYAAAAAALVLAAAPGTTPAQLREALTSTADPTAASPGTDWCTGAGLVDPAAAIAARLGTSPPAPAPEPTPSFAPITPSRVADSRTGAGSLGRVNGGTVTAVTVAGRNGVPADATAVAVNLTAIGVRSRGWLTAWPCGEARPPTSSVNFEPGTPTPNAAFVALGTGQVCLYASTDVDVLIDVTGFFRGDTDTYRPLTPTRIADSRRALGLPGRLAAGTTVRLPVRGGGGAPADASALTATVTAVAPAGPGWIAVWPCGTAMPTVSNLNTTRLVTRPNLVTAGVGDGGDWCIHTTVETDLLVDVAGAWGAGATAAFRAVTPSRVVDTRRALGGTTLVARQTLEIALGAHAPAGATAVAVNLTAIAGTTGGYVTAWPCDRPRPEASHVNYEANQVAASAAVVSVAPGARLCLWSSTRIDVIVDVNGWFD